MNHIQCPCLLPRRNSASTPSKRPSWAFTNLSRSNGSDIMSPELRSFFDRYRRFRDNELGFYLVSDRQAHDVITGWEISDLKLFGEEETVGIAFLHFLC